MAKKKPSPKSELQIPTERIERSIYVVRGHRIMMDSDLAELYDVPTKALNQAVKRNLHRFPNDFEFQLSADEWGSLRSQIVTLKTGRGRHRKYPPWVFTEHGVLMLASVLQSDRAASVNIHIVRAFVRLRRLMATPGELAQQLMELAETVQDHEGKIDAITQVLRELLKPADAKPKEMGFHTLK